MGIKGITWDTVKMYGLRVKKLVDKIDMETWFIDHCIRTSSCEWPNYSNGKMEYVVEAHMNTWDYSEFADRFKGKFVLVSVH